MPVVNALARELVFKIVYYGPGLGGKTSSLQFVHRASKPEHRGRMVSLATPVDRTLYFDFLPIRVPNIGNLSVRLQLFTVPGQVYYNATRRLVLTGADGVVFVADSQQARADANLESVENLRENLQQHGRSLQDVPHVLQYNKRDLPDLVPVEELEESLNWYGVPSFATIATNGEGVFESLEAVTRAVLEDFERRAPEPVPPSSRFEAPEGGLAEALRSAESSVGPPARELHHPEHTSLQHRGELQLQLHAAENASVGPVSSTSARSTEDHQDHQSSEPFVEAAQGTPESARERPERWFGATPWSSFAKSVGGAHVGGAAVVPSAGDERPEDAEMRSDADGPGLGAAQFEEPTSSEPLPTAHESQPTDPAPSDGMGTPGADAAGVAGLDTVATADRGSDTVATADRGSDTTAVGAPDRTSAEPSGMLHPQTQPTAPSPPSDLSLAELMVPQLPPFGVVSVAKLAHGGSEAGAQGGGPPLSFAELWIEGDRGAVTALERDLAGGRFGPALGAAHEVVRRELDQVGRRLCVSEEGHDAFLGVCQALALDVRRYLVLRAAAYRWRDGLRVPSRRAALEAYLFALEVRHSAAQLERELIELESGRHLG